MGHFKADCRKHKAGLAAGKVDNKGKGTGSSVRSITNEVPETPPVTSSSGSWPSGWTPAASMPQQWYPMMMPTPVPMSAVRHTPPTQPLGPSTSPTTISYDAPWMIMMIQPPRLVAAVRLGEYELALVDSGSGVVACPRDYAPEVPLLPPRAGLPPMVSATSESIKFYGHKVVHYVLDNGEDMAITWTVSNVTCLILAASALSRGGGSLTLAFDRDVFNTASGGSVDLIRDGGVPWLRLRRQTQGVRAVRVPMAIEEEEPPATRAATSEVVRPVPGVVVNFGSMPASAATAAAAGGSSGSGAASAAAAATAAGPREVARRGPAPIDLSEEARLSRGVRVPDVPTAIEKEQHYLTHIPFRAWCSFCVRAAAPDDPHRGLQRPDAAQKPMVMMDHVRDRTPA